MVDEKTTPSIALKQLNTSNAVDVNSEISTIPEIDSIKITSPPESPSDKQKTKFKFKKSWLMWWNSEEWWSCWIGLIFFGCIASAVKNGIPSPQFLPWDKNPFSTFAAPGNLCLPVIFVTMGGLLWISMAAIRAPNWKKFPLGYIVVFFIALISKMLASNGKVD